VKSDIYCLMCKWTLRLGQFVFDMTGSSFEFMLMKLNGQRQVSPLRYSQPDISEYSTVDASKVHLPECGKSTLDFFQSVHINLLRFYDNPKVHSIRLIH
jgi:hypothetical protein